jgi:CheY-like chemotaxis protein
MKILVVDDVHENRFLFDKLLSRMHHQVVLAENGQQAVDMFVSEQPDLILMDIMMPGMNGLEAIRAIRALPIEKWVPIFVVSALDNVKDIIDGLESGADDYLPKPISHTILRAKINSTMRSLELQQRIIKDSQQLKVYREENEQEHDFLQAIFERLIKLNDLKDINLQFWITPARRFSGDLVYAHRVDDNRLCFMLADSTGHGLAAALPTIIVNQVFQSMSKKGLPVAMIAREINVQLYSQLPPGRFVALLLGMLDSKQQTLEIWNGGLPDAFVLDDAGNTLHTFSSEHTFAGILSDRDFDDSCEIWHWQSDCELFIYSDGITEATDRQQQPFGCQRLVEVLTSVGCGKRVAAVRQVLDQFTDGIEAQDDISCLAVHCVLPRPS